MSFFREEEFLQKLMMVFSKITDPKCKDLDNTYLENLLFSLRSQCDTDLLQHLNHPKIFLWLSNIVHLWESHRPRVPVAAFICQLVGILSKKEEGFKLLQEKSILDNLISLLYSNILQNVALKVSYIRLLNDLVNHDAGCNWAIETNHWKTVVDLYFQDSNFYIEQEGLAFFNKLFKNINLKNHVTEEILQAIFCPLFENQDHVIDVDEKNCRRIRVSLKLAQGILKNSFISNSNSLCFDILKVIDAEKSLKFLLENCKQEKTLEMVSTLYILFLVLKIHKKNQTSFLENMPLDVLEVFTILLDNNHISCIIKLSKFCQSLWSDMRNEFKCESAIQTDFIIFQLIPGLLYTDLQGSKVNDSHIKNIIELTSPKSKKFVDSLAGKIKKQNGSRDWALKSLLSLTGNIDCLKNKEGILIFQSLTQMLSSIAFNKNWSQMVAEETDKIFKTEVMLPDEDMPVLSAILNSLSALLEKFKINWIKSLERTCLLKITSSLLQNTNLSSIIVVQTLLLVKLAILKLLTPDISDFADKTKNSDFKMLLPALHKHMHNPSWEIRDSCIEVITTIVELIEQRHSELEILLLEKDFCSLVCQIMESDAESYVRASALRALSTMIKLKNLRDNINNLNLLTKTIFILRTESEGIVRREAVLLINQIYLNFSENSDFYHSLYEIMGFAAICDLHWEVKVNSLLFWETVIQRVFASQGFTDLSSINSSFLKSEKVETLTNEEIKLRLDQVLKELSRIGCLYVLLSTLSDDCDFQVIEKSAQILSRFLEVLKHFDFFKPVEYSPSCRLPIKRKHNESESPQTTKSFDRIVNNAAPSVDAEVASASYCIAHSNAVIDEIVNEMDINLLVSVHEKREIISPSQDKVVLKEIKAESFLIQMQSFSAERFLENKKKWLVHKGSDLKSLLDDIITLNAASDTNIMDCY